MSGSQAINRKSGSAADIFNGRDREAFQIGKITLQTITMFEAAICRLPVNILQDIQTVLGRSAENNLAKIFPLKDHRSKRRHGVYI
ncbi:hypothetical protein PO124_27635 [Bacillus licheniformis]|nr:hypothetical protein [Bacillus licheniformis]